MRTPPFSPASASLNVPLPRPPAWICALTTQTGPSISPAAVLASSARSTDAAVGDRDAVRRAAAPWPGIRGCSSAVPSAPAGLSPAAKTPVTPENILAAPQKFAPPVANELRRAHGQHAPESGVCDHKKKAVITTPVWGAECEMRAIRETLIRRWRRSPCRPSTRPFTASTDLSNIAFSASLSAISIDPLDAAGADHRGHADVHALEAVGAVDVGGAGQDALLVLEVGLGHLDGGLAAGA